MVIVDAGAPALRDTVIEISGAQITGIRPADATELGQLHDLLMPGLIDSHSHGRAIAIERHGVVEGPLERFLVMLRAMTALDPTDEALIAADSGLAAGITATQVIHHTYGDTASYIAHARAIAAGFAQAQVRVFITVAVSDQDEYGPATHLAGIAPEVARSIPQPDREMDHAQFAEAARVLLDDPVFGLAAAHGGSAEVVFDGVGPIAPQWCSAAGNAAAGALRGSGRVHAHLLESAPQRLTAALCDPIATLSEAGLLGPWSSFGHGIWLEDEDRARLAAVGATVVHCPGSNRRTGAGSCRVRRLLDAGVPVALGIDSNSLTENPDPFAEMRLARELAQELGEPVSHAEVLGMATTGGARALCRDDLGTLTVGMSADLIALEIGATVDTQDPVRWVVDHGEPRHVSHRWIAGRLRTPIAAAARAARARLDDALAADAGARERRLGECAGEWDRVELAWNTLRAHIESRD